MENALQCFHVQRSTNLLCVLEDVMGIQQSNQWAQLGRCSIFSPSHTHMSKRYA